MPKPQKRSMPLKVSGAVARVTVPAPPPPDSVEAWQEIQQLALKFGTNRYRGQEVASPGIKEIH